MIIANDKINKLGYLEKRNIYDDKDNKIDLNNFNHSQSEICRNVKNDSEVLDVGCGAGIIGNFLATNKKCQVDGIDIDNVALEVTRKTGNYRKLYNTNIDQEDTILTDNKHYDCIIFADILEHLYDPIKKILEYTRMLKKNGKILVSIPNFAHYDVIVNLINNKFNYSEKGILDNTHLRFFTKESFIEYVENTNYKSGFNLKCKLIGQTKLSNELIDNKYPNLSRQLKKKEDSCVFQNIFEIKIESKNSKKTKIKYTDFALDLDKMINCKGNEDALKEELILKNKELNLKNQELDSKIKELNDIYNSKSWKITKPLRSIVRIFIGEKN